MARTVCSNQVPAEDGGAGTVFDAASDPIGMVPAVLLETKNRSYVLPVCAYLMKGYFSYVWSYIMYFSYVLDEVGAQYAPYCTAYFIEG